MLPGFTPHPAGGFLVSYLVSVRCPVLASLSLLRPVVPVSLASLASTPVWITTHSFRSGGAMALANAGLPTHVLQMAGRWKSDAFLFYVTQPVEMLRHLTTRMVQAACHEDTAWGYQPPIWARSSLHWVFVCSFSFTVFNLTPLFSFTLPLVFFTSLAHSGSQHPTVDDDFVAELDLPSGSTVLITETQMQRGFKWLQEDLHHYGYAELVTESRTEPTVPDSL